jgi:uncharacterized membrane protein YesL
MGKFFNPENFLWRGFGRIADFMFLSICFLVSSVPLVTIPAAAIALYDAIARCVYGDEGHPYRRFFRTFKSELMRSIGLTVLWALVAFVLGAGYQVLFQLTQNSSLGILTVVYYFFLAIPVGCFCWLIAIESRFVYTFGQLHKTALFFTFKHLPATVLITALGLATFEICFNMPFFLMLLPGICAYIQSIFVEKVFEKYLPKQEAE